MSEPEHIKDILPGVMDAIAERMRRYDAHRRGQQRRNKWGRGKHPAYCGRTARTNGGIKCKHNISQDF